jgi:beta-lactamase class A
MASLLKVPLAIAYYRHAETAGSFFSERILYDGSIDPNVNQNMKPKEELVAGKEYTVRDLIYRSLVYSDNAAASLLSNRMTPEYFDGVLTELGISKMNRETHEDSVSARTYAYMFRALYNASFLTRESSNELLKIMTQSAYQDGVRAVIPAHVRVASKFGERVVVNADTEEILFRQLHECGIVYAQSGKEPYSFCILTEGKEFAALQKVIQELSKTLYESLGQ